MKELFYEIPVRENEKAYSEEEKLAIARIASANLIEWQRFGMCNDADPALFDSTSKRDEQKAREDYCSKCIVQPQCLDYALEKNESGIWGGASDETRKEIHQRRRIKLRFRP